MTETFISLYEEAEKALRIARSTTDALIEAHHGRYGYDSRASVDVLMGIIREIDTAQNCINKMYDGKEV